MWLLEFHVHRDSKNVAGTKYAKDLIPSVLPNVRNDTSVPVHSNFGSGLWQWKYKTPQGNLESTHLSKTRSSRLRGN